MTTKMLVAPKSEKDRKGNYSYKVKVYENEVGGNALFELEPPFFCADR